MRVMVEIEIILLILAGAAVCHARRVGRRWSFQSPLQSPGLEVDLTMLQFPVFRV